MRLQVSYLIPRLIVCDVTDSEALARAVEAAGPVDVVVHNAVGGGWGTFSEIEPEMLENNFQVNVMALLHLARLTTPSMVQAGKRRADCHR